MHSTAPASPMRVFFTQRQETGWDLVVRGAPDTWVNLSLFISITQVEARRARSSLPPATERVSTVILTAEATFEVELSQSLILTVTGKTWCKLSSWPPLSWDTMDHASPFYVFQNKIKKAKKLLKGLCFWIHSKGSRSQKLLRQPHKPVHRQQ